MLREVFARAGTVSDPEMQSDYAKHLAVLVAGFLEQSVQELAIECARQQSSSRMSSYVESQVRRFRNANRESLLQFLARFDPSWRRELEESYSAELDALSSVYNVRHKVAHGENIGISLVRIDEYYENVRRLVRKLEELFGV